MFLGFDSGQQGRAVKTKMLKAVVIVFLLFQTLNLPQLTFWTATFGKHIQQLQSNITQLASCFCPNFSLVHLCV